MCLSAPGDVADAPTVIRLSASITVLRRLSSCCRISSVHPNEHGHMSGESLHNHLSLWVNIQPRLRPPITAALFWIHSGDWQLDPH